MAQKWIALDYERARKYLFKEATTEETNAIKTAMNAVQSRSPGAVDMGKYYLERLDAISLTIDQLSTKYAGVKTRPDGEGTLEYREGEPYETLRASARGFVKAFEKLTGLVAEGDFFQAPVARGLDIAQVEGLTDALADKADLVEGKVPIAQLPPASDAGHSLRTDNPHSVTAVQVGAATESDFNDHLSDDTNPHSVTAEQVGASPIGHTHTGLQTQSDLLDDIIAGFATAEEGQVIVKQGAALAYATATGGAGGEWLTVVSDRTCQDGDKLYVDTSGGSIALTLPATGEITLVPSISSVNNAVALLCDVGTKIEEAFGGRWFTTPDRVFRAFKVSSGWKVPPVEGYGGVPGWMPASVSQNTVYSTFTGTLRNLSNRVKTDGALTNGGNPAFIRYDLGTARPCNRVTVGGGSLGVWGDISPYLNGCKLQSSTDDITWTDRVTISGVTDTDPWLKTLSFDEATARYWRISGADYISTTEFTVWKG